MWHPTHTSEVSSLEKWIQRGSGLKDGGWGWRRYCTELNWIEIEDKSPHPGRVNMPTSSPFPSFSPPNTGKQLFNAQKENCKIPTWTKTWAVKERYTDEDIWRSTHKTVGSVPKTFQWRHQSLERPICLEPRVRTHMHVPLALQHGWIAKDHQTYERNPPTWKTKSKS